MLDPSVTDLPIERQYDDLLDELNGFLEARRHLTKSVLLAPIRHPLRNFKTSGSAVTALGRLDLLESRQQEESVRYWSSLLSAEEKKEPWFSILTAEYPLHALSTAIRRALPAMNVGSLVKYHHLKGTQLERFDPKGIFGVVFAAGTLLLQSIPQSVVERRFGFAYVDFEETVFWYTVAVLGYLFLILLPSWLKLSRARSVHRLIGNVLGYMAISEESAPVPTS